MMMMLWTKAPTVATTAAATTARRYAMIGSSIQVRNKGSYPERDKTKYVMGNTYSMDHDREVPVRFHFALRVCFRLLVISCSFTHFSPFYCLSLLLANTDPMPLNYSMLNL